MRRLIILFGLFMANAVAVERSPLAGVWEARINGLPGVELTIDDSGGRLDATVVFYFHLRGEDGKWRVAGESKVPAIEPHMEGNIFAFEVIHHKSHGSAELGPNKRYRVEITGSNEVAFWEASSGKDYNGFKLVKRK